MSEPFPSTPAVLPTLRQGFELLQSGRPAGAEELARHGLSAQPAHTGWRTLLALSLSQQGRADEALPLYRQLCESVPADAAHWSNLGTCLCDLGREDEALAPLQRARGLGRDDDALHAALARVYLRTGPARQGLAHAARALAHCPGDVELRLLHARLLLAADELQVAREQLACIEAEALTDAQRVDAATLWLQAGDALRADAGFATVLAHDPDHAAALRGRILALERLNRLDTAEQLHAHLRTLTPDNAPASLHVDARMALRRRDTPAALRALDQLLGTSGLDDDERVTVLFQRADALTRAGDIDEGMTGYAQAHALARRVSDARHPELARQDLYSALAEPAAPALPRWPELAGCGERDPVFVVGFPRSGTTLLEQLLDAHPQLVSFDEQPYIQDLTRGLYARGKDAASGLEALAPDDARALREHYFDSVRQATGALGGRRAVDKNPLNLIRLELLPHFFPAAHAILALRHPCDAVLSCYMQHFGAPSFAVAFETLDSAAALYDRVFTRWADIADNLAIPMVTVRYEDLVTDTSAQARRLFDALALPWSEDVLHFTEHARTRAIGTPSYAQVVQPVYRNAVNRWHRYRHHFSRDALQRLAPWAERFGYSMTS